MTGTSPAAFLAESVARMQALVDWLERDEWEHCGEASYSVQRHHTLIEMKRELETAQAALDAMP